MAKPKRIKRETFETKPRRSSDDMRPDDYLRSLTCLTDEPSVRNRKMIEIAESEGLILSSFD